MIIKLIDSKATAREAKRYAAVLADYIGKTDPEHRREAAALERESPVDRGLSVMRYMSEDDDHVVPDARDVPVRVRASGAMTAGVLIEWDAALSDMHDRLSRKLAPGAKPVRHVVGSLKESDSLPSDAQCENMGRVLLEELGCPEALLFWALHTDTDNHHVHFMIITVDPESASTTRFGNPAGYKDAMQRAIARLEDVHGFQRETGARYEVVGGAVRRTDDTQPASRRGPPIDNQILAWERESGLASFTRMAQERAAPALRDAGSWDEAHRKLAACGMAIQPRAGGGEIVAGDEHVKLARIGRDLTWRKLTAERRLGPYSAAPEDLELADYVPRIDDPVRFRQWSTRRERKEAIAAAARHRIQRLQAQRNEAVARIRVDAATMMENLTSGGPAYLRTDIRARIRAAREGDIAAVRSAFDIRIDAIRTSRDKAEALPAEAWFDLAGFSASDMSVTGTPLTGEHKPEPLALIGYDSRQVSSTVRYHAAGRASRDPAFTDHGVLIFVNRDDAQTISSVLSVAAARFGRVAVAGTPAFIAECRVTARRLGITIDVTHRGDLLAAQRKRTDVGWRRLIRPRSTPVEQAVTAVDTDQRDHVGTPTVQINKNHHARQEALQRAAKSVPTPRR